MENINLKCKTRDTRGKNAARGLRREGGIPANLIFAAKSTALSVPESDFNRLLKNGLHQSSFFNLEIENGEKSNQVYVKELQRHPVTGRVLHVDFYRVTPGKKVIVKISIETSGVSKGVKAGGALEHFIRFIKVKATPESLQPAVTVDIAHLDVGQAVYLQDLDLPAAWEVSPEGNPIVLKIARPRLEAATEVTDAPAEDGEAAPEEPDPSSS